MKVEDGEEVENVINDYEDTNGKITTKSHDERRKRILVITFAFKID
jgi:hypothetical protein